MKQSKSNLPVNMLVKIHDGDLRLDQITMRMENRLKPFGC